MNKRANYPVAWLTDWQRLCNFDTESLQFAQRAYREFLGGAERLQAEAFDYRNDAWHRYLMGAERLGKSVSAEETIAIQTDLANDAIQQFWHESRKMAQLLMSVGESVPHGLGRKTGRSSKFRGSQRAISKHVKNIAPVIPTS